MKKLFTIGVFGFSNDDFFEKLIDNQIDTFCDIRRRRGVRGAKYSFVNSNRLQNKMKLQIDATTIFAITNGKYNLGREVNFKDLKVKHPYNTYYIKGLPPAPISYVGRKTMELIFENYKSKYLYYFYNNIVKKHIYSESFKDHKRKLSEYRNKK